MTSPIIHRPFLRLDGPMLALSILSTLIHNPLAHALNSALNSDVISSDNNAIGTFNNKTIFPEIYAEYSVSRSHSSDLPTKNSVLPGPHLPFYAAPICSSKNHTYPWAPHIDGTCHVVYSSETLAKGRNNAILPRRTPQRYPDNDPDGPLSAFPRLNPREISNRLFAQGEHTPKEINRISAFLTFMGQFLDHDLSLTSENNQGHVDDEDNGHNQPIPIPNDDPYFDRSIQDEIEFTRSIPAEVSSFELFFRNRITAWLDLSSVYGSFEVRTRILRKYTGGLLLYRSGLNGEEYLPTINEANIAMASGAGHPAFYAAGDLRANEHPMLLAFHALFLRNHNNLARAYGGANPEATDELLFNWARRTNIMHWQHTVFTEWLPLVLGKKLYEPFKHYKGNEPAQEIDLPVEFTTAVFRFGHSMVPDELKWVDDAGKPVHTVKTAETFFRANMSERYPDGICSILRGMGTVPSERADLQVVDSLRNLLFFQKRNRAHISLDLVALNLQRGRDHGCGGINEFRKDMGLPKYKNYRQLTGNKKLARKLRRLYGRNIDNVDLFVALLAEPKYHGSILGETMAVSIQQRFLSLLKGDLYNFHELSKTMTPPGMTNPLTYGYRNNVPHGPTPGMARILDANCYPKAPSYVHPSPFQVPK
ncbi:hypothetical protein AAMO2058_000646700 [Amorphochlora amoebiformis]